MTPDPEKTHDFVCGYRSAARELIHHAPHFDTLTEEVLGAYRIVLSHLFRLREWYVTTPGVEEAICSQDEIFRSYRAVLEERLEVAIKF